MKETNYSNLPLQSGGVQGEIKGNFFNTVGLLGDDLAKAKLQTGSQEIKILELMRDNPTVKFTKFQVKSILVTIGKIRENTPESSISRALTQLKEKGQVLKLDEMQEGGLGKPNHLWTIKQDVPLVFDNQNSQLIVYSGMNYLRF
jgi:hypothetical protein